MDADVGVKCYLSITHRGCAHSQGTGSTTDSIHAFNPQEKTEEKEMKMKKRGANHQYGAITGHPVTPIPG